MTAAKQWQLAWERNTRVIHLALPQQPCYKLSSWASQFSDVERSPPHSRLSQARVAVT
jgi:hypothetical protein